jgi:hypothetical protein
MRYSCSNVQVCRHVRTVFSNRATRHDAYRVIPLRAIGFWVPLGAGSGVAIGHCLHVRSPQSLTLSRTRPNTVGAQLKMSCNVVNQELQPTTSFLRAPVILLDKLPFTLRIGRSQLLYFLLGALSDVIAALFPVHSIVSQATPQLSLHSVAPDLFAHRQGRRPTHCHIRSVNWGTPSHSTSRSPPRP